jgi:hypothetical protein
MAKAMQMLNEKFETTPKGQFGHVVVIRSGNVTIKNSELDCEFSMNFDDNTEADKAEITIYNLTDRTINGFKTNAKITITAGYGTDTGVIFSGFLTYKRTYRNGADKVTELQAVDDLNRVNREVESIAYAAGTKASYILKDLCGRVGLPIAVFKLTKDYTFTDEVTVDGSLSDAIKQYAAECGVSAYVCKSKINVRPLTDGDNTYFKLSADTGLISVSEFEEEQTTEAGKETVKGFEIECLLQHRMQTASIIELNSRDYKGLFRVREGSHEYDGTNFLTKAKIVAWKSAQATAQVAEKKTTASAAEPTKVITAVVDADGYIVVDSNGYLITER